MDMHELHRSKGAQMTRFADIIPLRDLLHELFFGIIVKMIILRNVKCSLINYCNVHITRSSSSFSLSLSLTYESQNIMRNYTILFMKHYEQLAKYSRFPRRNKINKNNNNIITISTLLMFKYTHIIPSLNQHSTLALTK